MASGEARIVWLRTVVAIIVAPLLPIYLLILSTGQVLPVVRFVDTYPTALAICVPLYLLLRFGRKTRLWHFVLFSFFVFGFLTFASTALSYQQLTFAASGGIDRVVDGELTVAGWLRCIQVGTVVGIYAALGSITVWAFVHWHVFNRVRGHLGRALSVLVLFVAANVMAFQAIDWSGPEPANPPPDGWVDSCYGGSASDMRVALHLSIFVELSESEWPRLHTDLESLSQEFGFDFFDSSSDLPHIRAFGAGICSPEGLWINADGRIWLEGPFIGEYEGVQISVRSRNVSFDWRPVAQGLEEMIQTNWADVSSIDWRP